MPFVRGQACMWAAVGGRHSAFHASCIFLHPAFQPQLRSRMSMISLYFHSTQSASPAVCTRLLTEHSSHMHTAFLTKHSSHSCVPTLCIPATVAFQKAKTTFCTPCIPLGIPQKLHSASGLAHCRSWMCRNFASLPRIGVVKLLSLLT